ncbi:MAG: GNAT family N-acetyltransferase [Firmicutes bacterium]|nr:GNAT family N-acetyltransferase [[Eubacterium] siraeum]MCM1486965.1 GNAT family N-acetyltransferase [Bacillota bacterium]
MITQIDSKTLHRLLNEARDIFSLKLAALAKAYEGYEFCKFYGAKDILIGKYYEELIIRAKGGISDEAAEELSLFLKVCGFKNALCSLETGKRLEALGWSNTSESEIFRFSSYLIPENEPVPLFSELMENPPLDEVFPIIKDGFPDVNYDDWYTDLNHRIRHDCAKVYLYGGATAAVMADINGGAFISLVAAKKEERGKGEAKSLLRCLGLHFEKQGKEASVLCRQELSPFYKKAGFYEVGRTVTVFNG